MVREQKPPEIQGEMGPRNVGKSRYLRFRVTEKSSLVVVDARMTA